MNIVRTAAFAALLVAIAILTVAQSSHPQPTTLADGSYPGEIRAFAFEKPPAGWLECDGRKLKVADHKRLARAIGTNWGATGSPLSTEFYLPDLRGRFVRGWNHGAPSDPDAGTRSASATNGNSGDRVGSVQGDQFASHGHTLTLSNRWGDHANGSGWGGDDGNSGNTQRTTDPVGGSETRPKNAYLMFCIRDAN